MTNQEITPSVFNLYAEQFSSPEDEVLISLNKETSSLPGSQMISGHLQGQLLKMISRIVKPRNILELGTYTGYSAICLAYGLQENGKLYTVDKDERFQELRNSHWKRAGFENVIVQHIGDASEVIQNLNIENVDLVFIDADKRNYGLYFDLLIEKLPKGALLLADNVLFHGEVVLPKEEQGKNAQFMNDFNQKIASDSRVEQVILPVRDGITLIRKI